MSSKRSQALITPFCAASSFALTFIEKGGVPGLISILAMYRAPPFALRLAIAALASLVASCGASGCEAVLEWNNPEAAAADEEMTEVAAELQEEDTEHLDADAAGDQVRSALEGLSWFILVLCLSRASQDGMVCSTDAALICANDPAFVAGCTFLAQCLLLCCQLLSCLMAMLSSCS